MLMPTVNYYTSDPVKKEEEEKKRLLGKGVEFSKTPTFKYMLLGGRNLSVPSWERSRKGLQDAWTESGPYQRRKRKMQHARGPTATYYDETKELYQDELDYLSNLLNKDYGLQSPYEAELDEINEILGEQGGSARISDLSGDLQAALPFADKSIWTSGLTGRGSHALGSTINKVTKGTRARGKRMMQYL